MPSKETEKLDGVFDTSAGEKGEKTAAKPDKPARPPKPKTPLSRETKVGLAVIAALLVIFVVVIVVRLRGGGGQPVASGDTTAQNAADKQKPTQKQQQASPAAGRTLIAQTETPRQPQFLFDKASSANDASATGSAYGGRSAYANDDAQRQSVSPEGYLPARTGQYPSSGAVASDTPAGASVDPETDHSLRQDRFTAPEHRENRGTEDSAQSAGIANPFAQRITLGSDAANTAPANESIVSDQAAADNDRATPAGAALVNPFEKNGAQEFDKDLSRTPSGGGIGRLETLATKNASAVDRIANAQPQATAGDDELEEAETFAPNAMRSTTGAGRLPGNEFGAQNVDVDTPDIAVGADPNDGRLQSVKGRQFAHGQNLDDATHEAPAKASTPFRAPNRLAAEPTRLDDEVNGAEGQAPAPLRHEPRSDEGKAYVVAANDTYWTIAKENYGSGAYFKALYEHNRRRQNNADSLQPGMQLTIPDEATLQRLYPTLCPRPQRLAAAARATRASFNSASGNQQYVVGDGDTLYDIARRRLGNASRWAEVYELNREAIGSATDRLQPGTPLILPAR